MRIFAIDDEPKMLQLLRDAITEAEPKAEITSFLLGSEAVAHIEETGIQPDVVFSDIRMPGLSGLELAVRLKQLSPETKIVFVTGYDYAIDAYRLHVSGYIPKPVEAERVRDELDNIFPDHSPAPDRLRVQCFGNFEVFWQNEPLSFSRRQTKEMFAFLVDRRGAACTSEDIVSALWEDEDNIENAKHRVRNFTRDMKSVLLSIGMHEVLVSQGHRHAVRTDLLDCDYYRMLAGDMAAVNAFRGEYMEQYSWAEITKGSLVFQHAEA